MELKIKLRSSANVYDVTDGEIKFTVETISIEKVESIVRVNWPAGKYKNKEKKEILRVLNEIFRTK